MACRCSRYNLRASVGRAGEDSGLSVHARLDASLRLGRRRHRLDLLHNLLPRLLRASSAAGAAADGIQTLEKPASLTLSLEPPSCHPHLLSRQRRFLHSRYPCRGCAEVALYNYLCRGCVAWLLTATRAEVVLKWLCTTTCVEAVWPGSLPLPV